LINLEDIKSRGAITLLQTYNGINPYLKALKQKLINNDKVALTEGQVEYINKFYDVEPQVINRVVSINPLLGESLKDKHKLSFLPEKMLIQAMLADQEKTYHVYGKLKKNQKNAEMYWLPKTLVLDDPYFTECEVEVNWEKYEEMDVMGRHPYEHQKEGIKFLVCRKGAILADDMGLGKTYQSIVAALEVDAKKVLVICPASVKISWQREIESFDQKAIIVSGSKWPEVGRFTVINFDILKNFHTIGEPTKDKNGNFNPHNRNIVNEKYDLVIIDEAHKIKDHKTQRGQIANEIALTYGIERVWELTGTPIANRPMDFFNILKMIKSPLADNWKFFAQRYCDAKRFHKTLKNGQRRQIWITNGASNLDELAIRTKNSLLRRLKTEVLDMPDKTVSTIYHKLSKRGEREYESIWDEYMEKRAEEGKRKISDLSKDIVELGLLRKFIAMETIPNTIELAKDAIEQGQKVVIFTTFTDELNEIADNFTNSECVIHNGKMTANAKQKSVDSFQNNKKCKVFIGNITSAGVGITLTEGTVVIFNSFSWVPGDNEQAEDRCYRIGQKSNVSVYYQLFTGTISLVMWYTLMRKQEIINKIINKKDEHGDRLKMLLDDLEENGLEL
jgi:SWI/SNF-related matrix-associated actin-dependent regulator 1 of chromatin subfamily A